MIFRFLPFLLLFAQHADAQPVLISEYLPAPSTNEQEFIELILKGSTNLSTVDVNVRDRSSRWSDVEPTYELMPGDTLLLYRKLGDVSETFPSSRIKMATLSPWPTLNNTGDSLLVQVNEQVTDRTGYSMPLSGLSIERKSDVIPGYIDSNWGPSRDPSGSTPGRRNSVHEVDTTPPRLLGAEFSLNKHLWIWFSEALPAGQPIRVELHQDQASTFSITVESTGNHYLTSSDVPDHLGSAIRVSAVRDYAGHLSEPATIEIARAPVLGEVTINEVLYHDRNGGAPDFVELYVASDRLISLRELYLSSDLKLFALVPPDTTLLAPSGTAILISSGNMEKAVSDASISFAQMSGNAHVEHLSNASGILTTILPSLRIYNNGSTIRLHLQSDTLDAMSIDQVCSSPRFDNVAGRSVRRQAGSPCEWTHTLLPTGTSPGLISQPLNAKRPAPGDLRISEILYDTIADPFDNIEDQVEFIELINVSGVPLDVSGLYFSSPSTDSGETTDLPFLHAQTRLGIGEVALVFHYPRSIPDEVLNEDRILRSIWPNARNPTGTVFLPVRQSLALSNSGELIFLMSSQRHELDRVWIGTDRHHPAVKNTKGRSIVRLLSVTGQLGDWSTSTHIDGATPGYTQIPPKKPQEKSGLFIDRTSFYPSDDASDNEVSIELFSKNESDIVRIRVFSADGRAIKELVAGKFIDHGIAISWKGRDQDHYLVPSGIYIILAEIFNSHLGSHRAYKKAIAVLR